MHEIEIKRERLQMHLDSQKSQRERNVMGQFATPYPLALDIMKYLYGLVDNRNISLFEPAIGTGVFYSAFAEVFGRDKEALGLEIDKHYYEPASQLWHGFPLEIRHADFFDTHAHRQFPLLVANPPYIRHHHISKELKLRLQLRSSTAARVKVSGLCGLYCHFLILSEAWLTDNGVSCWLIPSEFMDVNYGQALKHYLLNNVDLIRVHRFNADDLQFADALVSSCIVIFRKAAPNPDKAILFTMGGSVCKPAQSRRIERSNLSAGAKWTHLFEETPLEDGCTTTLGSYFTVKRGIVTGDNNFFLVDQATIDQYGIDARFLRPILPSPRYIKGDIVEVGGETSDAHRRQFLFSCNLTEEELKEHYPGTWRYIKHGETQGVQNGYICSRRTPWYSCEDRNPASIVVPYMGRSDTGNRLFRFILNETKALTTNVYLLLYPKPQYAHQLGNRQNLLQVWKALNAIPPERIARSGRFYGGGLRKMEPGELMNIPMSEIGDIISRPTPGIQLSAF